MIDRTHQELPTLDLEKNILLITLINNFLKKEITNEEIFRLIYLLTSKANHASDIANPNEKTSKEFNEQLKFPETIHIQSKLKIIEENSKEKNEEFILEKWKLISYLFSHLSKTLGKDLPVLRDDLDQYYILELDNQNFANKEKFPIEFEIDTLTYSEYVTLLNLNEIITSMKESNSIHEIKFTVIFSFLKTRLFQQAAAENNIKLIKELLNDADVQPQADDDFAFKIAALRGHVEVLDCLLRDERINPHADNHFALRSAIYFNQSHSLEFLLTNSKTNKNLLTAHEKKLDLIIIPIVQNNFSLLKRLITFGFKPTAYDLTDAAACGHLEIIKFLAARGLAVNTEKNAAIRNAADNGHLEVVEWLLDYTAPCELINTTFSSEHWRDKLHLINDTAYVRKSNKLFYYIKKIESQIKEIEEIIIEIPLEQKTLEKFDKDFNPDKLPSYKLFAHQIPKIELLTGHRHLVDPFERVGNDCAFTIACFKGHVDIVKKLLSHKNINSEIIKHAISFAVKFRQPESLRCLLSDTRVNASDYKEELIIACKSGHADLVEVFLNAKSIDSLIKKDGFGLELLRSSPRMNVLAVLWRDERIRKSAPDYKVKVISFTETFPIPIMHVLKNRYTYAFHNLSLFAQQSELPADVVNHVGNLMSKVEIKAGTKYKVGVEVKTLTTEKVDLNLPDFYFTPRKR